MYDSIGSMGAYPDEGGVEHIVVNNSIFTSSDNGVRIKTWAKPSDTYAKTIMFENLQMKNVANPIIIDQKYCPGNNCPHGVHSCFNSHFNKHTKNEMLDKLYGMIGI